MILLGMLGPWQLFLLIVLVSIIVLPIITLIHALKHDFKGRNKLIWILIILLLPLFGAILYLPKWKKSVIKNN